MGEGNTKMLKVVLLFVFPVHQFDHIGIDMFIIIIVAKISNYLVQAIRLRTTVTVNSSKLRVDGNQASAFADALYQLDHLAALVLKVLLPHQYKDKRRSYAKILVNYRPLYPIICVTPSIISCTV